MLELVVSEADALEPRKEWEGPSEWEWHRDLNRSGTATGLVPHAVAEVGPGWLQVIRGHWEGTGGEQHRPAAEPTATRAWTGGGPTLTSCARGEGTHLRPPRAPSLLGLSSGPPHCSRLKLSPAVASGGIETEKPRNEVLPTGIVEELIQPESG